MIHSVLNARFIALPKPVLTKHYVKHHFSRSYVHVEVEGMSVRMGLGFNLDRGERFYLSSGYFHVSTTMVTQHDQDSADT